MARGKYIILILLLLPVLTQGQVPDTDSFGLDTVVKVVRPEYATLSQSHQEADPKGYDGTYVGDTNSLYSFRNYNHYENFIFGDITHRTYNGASISLTDGSWFNIQDATSGDNLNTGDYYSVRVEDLDGSSGTIYIVSRGFITFNLDDIPSTASIINAEIRFVIASETTDGVSNHGFIVCESNHGENTTEGDYDAFNRSNIIFDYGTLYDYRLDNVLWKEASNLSYIENRFGTYVQFALIHAQDIGVEPHDDVVDKFQLYRRGEGIMSGDYPRYPVLMIEYEAKTQ